MPRHARNVLVGAFVVTSLIVAAFPVSIHFKTTAADRADRAARTAAAWPLPVHIAGNQNKDYGLWYPVGLVARSDTPLYPTTPGVPFPFMYPPFAAAVLAWLSHLGPTGMLFALVLANVAAWAAAVWLGVTLVAPERAAGVTPSGPGGDGSPAPRPDRTGSPPPLATLLLWGLPSAVCVFFVYEMVFLGQPNLGLLALLLAGFHLLRAGRHGLAGAMFATAAAVKAFPAVVLVYLLWRRHWRAAAGMVAVTAGLLVVVPVPTRGWDRNLSELGTWADGMVFKTGGQRPEQSQSWRNQSVVGVGHRLLGRVNATPDPADYPAELYVNVLDLDRRTAARVIAGACGLLGVGFAAVLPRRRDRTRATDAAEYALLTVLVLVGTPYAFGYYFVWLLFPATVLVGFAVGDPAAAARRGSWAVLGVGFGLVAVGAPLTDSKVPAAAGAFLWGALVLAGGLGWHLWRAGRGTMAAGGAT